MPALHETLADAERIVGLLITELVDETVAAGDMQRIVRSVIQSYIEGDRVDPNEPVSRMALQLTRELFNEPE